MSMPGDFKNIQMTSKRLEAETLNERMDNVEAAPPADTSWRYRRDGAPKALALAGVVLGFVLLIVPGLLALRSYRRWESGVAGQPTFAWVMAIIGGVLIVAVPLFHLMPFVVGALAVLVAVPLIALVGPDR